MNKSIETIQVTRKKFLLLTEGLSIDELNKIPVGFNNNIIWNLGHIIVSQQILCYKLSGLPLKIDESYVLKYSKDTKPVKFSDEKEFNFLKMQSIHLADELDRDFEKNMFENFKPYTSGFGIELNNIEDVLKYLTMHEGLHLGYAMALKRVIH